MAKKEENRFEIQKSETIGAFVGLKGATILLDKETGVNYLFYQEGYAGGLTPLLDADGKPVITKSSERGVSL